ncbi:unnamed protein product [Linum trigynum]|uniref:Uncharacterized protein n=1 Tax=Linum trigynum TaxID=586398 RepID=A0AAV2DDE6_9ROSI
MAVGVSRRFCAAGGDLAAGRCLPGSGWDCGSLGGGGRWVCVGGCSPRVRIASRGRRSCFSWSGRRRRGARAVEEVGGDEVAVGSACVGCFPFRLSLCGFV